MAVKCTRVLALVISSMASVASAGEGSEADRAARELLRPHTIAEVEAGIMALPNAPISVGRRGGETPFGGIGQGDATLMIGMHLLYRGDPRWMVGAAAMFGPEPTADTQYGGRNGLDRTHARSYLAIGAEGRYYPLRVRLVEAYVGVVVGGVVVADRFSNNSGEKTPTIYGLKEATVRTEGASFGLSVGGRWNFARSWAFGVSFRAEQWLLPTESSCLPVGDCGTLNGGVLAISGGLVLGYRIPL